MYRFLFRRRLHSASAPPRPRSRLFIPGAVTASLISYTLGSTYPPESLSLLFPRPAPPPPSDPNSAASLAYAQNIEDNLQSLPFLQKLRSEQDAAEWYETRPYTHFPEERRVNHLTAGCLRGPGKLAVRPLLRVRKDEKESVVILHLGRALCGYDGIVHGGLLATVLDETLGRTAINNLPDKVGVTKNLELKYKAPTKADQFVVIRTKLGDVQGRRADVSGRIEDLQGNVLVEATATFVQPRYAKLINSSIVRKAMGEPITPSPSANT